MDPSNKLKECNTDLTIVEEDKLLHEVFKKDTKMFEITKLVQSVSEKKMKMKFFLENLYDTVQNTSEINEIMDKLLTDIKNARQVGLEWKIENEPISFLSINEVPIEIKDKYITVPLEHIEKDILYECPRNTSPEDYKAYMGSIVFYMLLLDCIYESDEKRDEIIDDKNVSYIVHIGFNFKTNEHQGFTASLDSEFTKLSFYQLHN